MEIKTVLALVLAALVALGLVLFQYFHKTGLKGRLYLFLALLRFLAIYALLVLLINPKFTRNNYTVEKAKLVLLTDNSASMAASSNQVDPVLREITSNSGILEKYEIERYRFSNQLAKDDSLTFDDPNTDLADALATINEIYGSENTAVIMLTDGNQTFGNDYAFMGSTLKFPVYPVAIGDTTRYEDLRIDQVNVNKYAFLKNKFPVETTISYQGNNAVTSEFSISIDGNAVYKERINLSNKAPSKIVTPLIEASSVGIKSIVANIRSIDNEKNTTNNSKLAAIEVIDEKTNIGIISKVLHPDIGALAKAIKSNEQRTVALVKPTLKPEELEKFDIILVYQPDTGFKTVMDFIRQKKVPHMIVGGNKTDWAFLNQMHTNWQIEVGYPNQEITPVVNEAFSKFNITDFLVEGLPPLESNAGNPTLKSDAETMMTMGIRGVKLNNALMWAGEAEGAKQIVLLGENIWKWRMHDFRNHQNFDNFDRFVGKLMVYLTTNLTKDRLNIENERIYDAGNQTTLTATYFDEAFLLDANATLLLKVTATEIDFSKEMPLLFKGNFFEADLKGLPAANYTFTVTVKDGNISKSGSFTILDFNIEQQLTTTNHRKLQQLSLATGGQLFFPSQTDSLAEYLLRANRFLPTQKEVKNVVSLIDFKILMAIIVAALALEWLIRKYNGLT